MDKAPRPEGLSYSEGERILKKNKLPNINPNARKTLLNQVKLQEGAEQAKALDMATRENYKGIKGLTEFNPRAGRGRGNGYGGIGDPKPCSLKEGFEKVGPSTYKKVYGK